MQSSISNDFATIGRSGLSNADGVSAYLNYILLDETFTFVSAGYQMLPDNADASHQQLAMELIPEQDGYVYIYLTNESQQLTDVYFDDFKVTHEVLIKDPQLEAYRYGFNGKEKDSKGEFGLNHYDYGFRIYNPAIAKFLSVDPLTSKYASWSPYPFAMNRPIDGIDLDGLEWFKPFLLRPIGMGTQYEVHKEAQQVKLRNPDYTIVETAAAATWNRASLTVHTSLDVAGMFPGAGEPADLINGAIYTLEGEYVDAGLSFGAAVPFAGWSSTITKYSLKTAKVVGTKIYKFTGFGGDIISKPDVITTVLGRYKGAIKHLKTDGVFFDTKLNFLNLDDETIKVAEQVKEMMGETFDWFRDLNKTFLDEAIERGDDIRLVSDPNDLKNIFVNGKDASKGLTTFGKEIDYLKSKDFEIVGSSMVKKSN